MELDYPQRKNMMSRVYILDVQNPPNTWCLEVFRIPKKASSADVKGGSNTYSSCVWMFTDMYQGRKITKENVPSGWIPTFFFNNWVISPKKYISSWIEVPSYTEM